MKTKIIFEQSLYHLEDKVNEFLKTVMAIDIKLSINEDTYIVLIMYEEIY